MIKQEFVDLYDQDIAADAILNEEYTGFKQDYLMLHILLRKFKPKTVFEIGTNMGTGTKIIKNAVGEHASVFSLDLPTELAHKSLQHPINEGKGDSVGHRCNLPFTQLRGDSLQFNYRDYPCEAYFIDGEHDYIHAHHETRRALEQKPNLIIWHDSDIEVVMQGILDAFEQENQGKFYTLYRIIDTRIAYAVRK